MFKTRVTCTILENIPIYPKTTLTPERSLEVSNKFLEESWGFDYVVAVLVPAGDM